MSNPVDMPFSELLDEYIGFKTREDKFVSGYAEQMSNAEYGRWTEVSSEINKRCPPKV